MLVDKEEIFKGLANNGTYICNVKEEGNSCFNFFEKRIKKNTNEYKILSALNSSRVSFDPFVNVLGSRALLDGYVAVYMEFLPGAGEFNLKNIADNSFEISAKALAKNICEGLYLINSFLGNHKNSFNIKMHELSASFPVHLAKFRDEIDSGLFRELEDIFATFLRNYPLQENIVSHNDLYFPNIWVRNGDLSVKIIDYGLIGKNFIGADLHYFYMVSTGKREVDRVFFRYLSERYSSTFGVPLTIVRLAACYYAIVRQVMRVVKKSTLSHGSNKQLDFMIDEFWSLTDLISISNANCESPPLC